MTQTLPEDMSANDNSDKISKIIDSKAHRIDLETHLIDSEKIVLFLNVLRDEIYLDRSIRFD